MKPFITVALLLLAALTFAAPAPTDELKTEREAIEAAKDIEASAQSIHEARKLYRAKKKAGEKLKKSDLSKHKWKDAKGNDRQIGKPPILAEGEIEKFKPR